VPRSADSVVSYHLSLFRFRFLRRVLTVCVDVHSGHKVLGALQPFGGGRWENREDKSQEKNGLWINFI